MRLKIVLLITLLFLCSCSPALQSKPSEVANLQPNQGVIVGSLIMRLRDEQATLPISLADKTWYAEVRRDDAGFFAKTMPSGGRALFIKADGKEIPFVAVLSPGIYALEELVSQGLAPNFRVKLKARFVVEGKKKIYIGRLVITIPKEMGTLDPILFKRRGVDVTVEDAQSDTIAALSGEYGSIISGDLQKGLMTIR
jgi:hypothetical protein